jgi:AraC-like DNA-binding protein
MNVTTIFLLAGIALGLLLIFALLIRGDDNPRANRLLSLSLVCSMSYLCGMVMIHGDFSVGNMLPPVMISLYLLASPLMYGYVRLLIDKQRSLNSRDLLHLLPWAVVTLLLLTLLPLTSGALQMARGGWPPHPVALISPIIYIVPAIYMYISLRLLRLHQQNMNEIFSYQERHNLYWLRMLVTVYLALSLAGLCIALIRWVPGIELWPRSLYSTSMIIALYYLTAFIAISQPAVPRTEHEIGPEPVGSPLLSSGEGAVEPQPAFVKPRYETSALDEQMMEQIWQKLKQFMEERQPYLDNKLRIADLAQQLEIPTHYLSQTINQVAGKSFFELINQYRVETAKKLLETEGKPTSSAAFDAGFNSTSAFYRQFKKDTGMTPRQYRDDLRASEAASN